MLTTKAQKIKSALIKGIGESAETLKFQKAALDAAEKCQDSEYWIRWGSGLLERDWNRNGSIEILSARLRAYSKQKEKEIE